MAAVMMVLPCILPAAEQEPVIDPQGEWYAVGYRMAGEALPGFRMMELPETAMSRRMNGVLGALGVQTSSLKNSEIKLLQQGWNDGLEGKSAALTFPPDQPKSLLPAELRGFYKFHRKPGAGGAENLADKVVEWKKAAAKVLVTLPDGTAHGSGFFIGPGLLLTNGHVVEGATQITVKMEADGSEHSATVLAQMEVPDVALVQIDKKDNEFLPLGVSANCRELQEVVMIGYPEFDNLSATSVKGSISATHRVFDGVEVMQLDIRVNGGDSGAPIITTDGCVVGILTFWMGKTDAKLAQFSLAQPIDAVLPFLEKHAKGKFEREE